MFNNYLPQSIYFYIYVRNIESTDLFLKLVDVLSLLFHFLVLSVDLVVMVVPSDEELLEHVRTCGIGRHHSH